MLLSQAQLLMLLTYLDGLVDEYRRTEFIALARRITLPRIWWQWRSLDTERRDAALQELSRFDAPEVPRVRVQARVRLNAFSDRKRMRSDLDKAARLHDRRVERRAHPRNA